MAVGKREVLPRDDRADDARCQKKEVAVKRLMPGLLIFCFFAVNIPVFAQEAPRQKGASATAYEHASDEAVFHRVGDWFATVGKTDQEKKAIIAERKAKRAVAKAEKEAEKAKKQAEKEAQEAKKEAQGKKQEVEKGLKQQKEKMKRMFDR